MCDKKVKVRSSKVYQINIRVTRIFSDHNNTKSLALIFSYQRLDNFITRRGIPFVLKQLYQIYHRKIRVSFTDLLPALSVPATQYWR